MKLKDSRAQRIELLQKYYPVDTKKKTVTFKLYYDHASELLDYTVGETGKEMFKDEFLDKISSILDKIPLDYKANIILEIEDYDVYNEEIILEKFNDLLEMNSYDARRLSKKNGFASAILLIVGCIILTINAILTTYSPLGNGTILSNVLYEALDITSWVFVWQAVTILFLSPSQASQYIITIFHKLNSFSIATKGEIKVTKGNELLAQKCGIDSSFSNVQKQILAIVSTLLFFEGFVMLIESIIGLITGFSSTTAILDIYQTVLAVFTMACGICSLSRFTEKFIGNRKIILWFSLTALMTILYFLHGIFNNGDWSDFIHLIMTIILLIVSGILCFFWRTLGFRNPKKKEMQEK